MKLAGMVSILAASKYSKSLKALFHSPLQLVKDDKNLLQRFRSIQYLKSI